MPIHHPICLVQCVSQKNPKRALARDLYVSHWFRLARRYVETIGCPWFILSAKHGLVAPDQILAPYEQTLNTMAIADRRAWACSVETQMEEQLGRLQMPSGDRIVILAGLRYREFLMDYLRRRFSSVEVPMEGLRIGEQLSWLQAWTSANQNGSG